MSPKGVMDLDRIIAVFLEVFLVTRRDKTFEIFKVRPVDIFEIVLFIFTFKGHQGSWI